MKIFLILFLSSCFLPSCIAQDKDLHVVASAGSSYESGGLVLDWTLGEVIIHTLEKPSIIVTQGFHQPQYSLVHVNTIPLDKGVISVLPNPFPDDFEIKMNFTHTEKGMVHLYSLDGSLLWKKPFEGKEVIEKYNASILPSGSYILSVSISDNSFIQTFTILKTQ